MPESIVVAIRLDFLRDAIVSRLAVEGLAQTIGVSDLFEVTVGAGGVVVVLANECNPASCLYFIAGRRLRMGILTALPSIREQTAYERLGAVYIPMSLEPRSLVKSVQGLLDMPAPDSMLVRPPSRLFEGLVQPRG
jgi:hypothetical protein